jgi:hypothetical protein
MRSAFKILFRGRNEKESFGRRRCRWKDNIKMDLKDTGFEDVELIQLVHDRVQLQALRKSLD